MKPTIKTIKLKETLLVAFLMIVILFNNYKYGTLLKQVAIVLVPLMLLLVSSKAVIQRALPFLAYGIVWCVSFLIGTIIYSGNAYVESLSIVFVWFLIIFTCLFIGISFKKKQLRFLLLLYTICNSAISINIILNYIAENFYIDRRSSFFINGVYKDPNYVSSLIVPALFLALIYFKREHKVLYKLLMFFSIVLMSIAVLITGSRAALVGVLTAIGVYIVLQFLDYKTKIIYKISIIILVIIGIIAGCYIILKSSSRFTDISAYLNDIRIVIWTDGLNFWTRSPIVGNGVSATSNYTLTCWYNRATHNCFIDLLGDSGIVGMFCLISIWARIIREAKEKKLVIVFLTICMVPQAFINGFYSFNFWFMICLTKLYADYMTILFKEKASCGRR